MTDDYYAQKDGIGSYLHALEDKRQRGSMGNWENRSPIKKEVVIGECAGTQVTFIGDVRRVAIYAIALEHGHPVYVGSTSQPLRTRMRGHVHDAKAGSPLPIHEWMRQQPGGFTVEVLEWCDDRPSTRAVREQYWVSKFEGLLNVTDGGLGGSGTVWPAERRERMAAAIRNGGKFSCQQCGEEFWRKRRDILKGHNKFCSRGCYQQSIRGKSRPIPEHVRARGVAASAKRRKELTHCGRGHPFNEENMRVNKSGSRVCRICERAYKRPRSVVSQ
jgi:hypothetical protein